MSDIPVRMNPRNSVVTEETRAESKRLKELWESTVEQRHARGVGTQAAFGAEYGIGNQAAVWQFLNGRVPLSLKAAAGFARGLGCAVRDFSPRLAKQSDALIVVLDEAHRSTRPATLLTTGEAPPSSSAYMAVPEAEAQRLSVSAAHDPPTLKWEGILGSELPPQFSVVLPDDAMAPKAPRGTTVRMRRGSDARQGDGVLLHDAAGNLYFRRLQQRTPTHWRAIPANDAFAPLDSIEDGLTIIGVMTGLDVAWSDAY